MRWRFLLAALGAGYGCTTVAGLDGLVFDEGSGGAPASATGSGAAASSSGGASSSNAGGGGGSPGSGATGGGGAGGNTGGAGGSGGDADTYGTLVLADTPLGYWRFDDAAGSSQATDSSGNGHHGVYENGVVLGQPGIAAGNAAATFDGVNDAVSVSGPFSFAPNAAFSVEAWVLSNDDDGMIVGRKGLSTDAHPGWWMAVRQTTEARFDRGAGHFLSTMPFNQGAWNYIVGTYDGTEAALYVNGTRVAQNQSALIDPGGPMTIGDGVSWGALAATIDEVAVYDYALTPAQVDAHFAAGQLTLP